MKFITYLATALALLLASESQAVSGSSGPFYFDGSFYAKIYSTSTWQSARDRAADMKFENRPGHLVTILSEDEHDFVNDVRDGSDCWIGANDLEVEGEWRWVTGELFWVGAVGGSVQPGMFEAWNNGEPNNSGDEDVAHMFSSGVNAWNDLKTSSTRSCFLVEFPGELVPVPALGPVGLGGLILLLGLLGWRYTRQS